MIKVLLTVALLGSVGGHANLAIAQGKQGEALGSDAASLQARLAAQCAHRRTMPPDPRDDCARKLRNEAQAGYGQGGIAAGQAAVAGPGTPGQGAGLGNEGGQGNGPGGQGIGPGSGGGQGKGRR